VLRAHDLRTRAHNAAHDPRFVAAMSASRKAGAIM
jgi:hypothetical protein